MAAFREKDFILIDTPGACSSTLRFSQCFEILSKMNLRYAVLLRSCKEINENKFRGKMN